MPLADAKDIMNVAVRMLGEYLQVDRCAYAEVDTNEDAFIVLSEYTRGATASIVPTGCECPSLGTTSAKYYATISPTSWRISRP